MTEAIQQIRYAWSESSLLGNRGMGPVESTLGPDELSTWDRLLRDHVWAAQPEPGYTYLSRDGMGMLLRKMATTAGDGRPGSAARVLLSSRLTAAHALGLTCWDGWDAPALAPLAWIEIESCAERGLSLLRDRARSLLADRLAAIFAQVLSAPGDSYTVIGEPEPLALVSALGDLTGQTPTFASDETDDTGNDLPAVVFIRASSVSRVAATRRRLSADGAAVDPAVAGFAAAVVDAYLADGPEGVVGVLPGRPPADAAEVMQWARRGQFAPGVIADLTRLPRLSDRLLGVITTQDALRRIGSATDAASDTELAAAIDARLPEAVLLILAREGLKRVSRLPSNHPLLASLSAIRPLSVELVAEQLSGGFEHRIRVSRHLLTEADRRRLLGWLAREIQPPALIGWIAEHAADDPEAAQVLFAALRDRARQLSKEDLRVLASHAALAEAARGFSPDVRHAAASVAALLRALPLTQDLVVELIARPDPVVLHALDTIVADPRVRVALHRRIRQVYYYEHNLAEPPPASSDDNQPPRRSPLRRRSSHGKQM